MKFIIIGFGYWGKNFIKLFQSDSRIELVAIVDVSNKNLEYPVYSSLDELIKDNIEFIFCVATPTATHFDYVKLLEV